MTQNSPTRTEYDDEIDLFELIENLWQEKGVIIVITLIVTALATSYAYWATPIYRVSGIVSLPTVVDIAELNKISFSLKRSDSNNLDQVAEVKEKPTDSAIVEPEAAYQLFISNLNSSAMKTQFFNEHYFPSHSEAEQMENPYNLYHSLLQLSVSDLSKQERHELQLESSEPAAAEDLLARYLTWVAEVTQEELVALRAGEITLYKEQLDNEMSTLRNEAAINRAFEISRLEEALTIAEEIGLENPLTPTGKSALEGAIYVDRTLPYTRGAKALRAQLKQLNQRESDDPFIPELAALTSVAELYQGVSFAAEKITPYQLEQAVNSSGAPIKPKKKLIVIIGFLLGGMLGVGAALVGIVIRNRKMAEA